jgi:hypothetical protein
MNKENDQYSDEEAEKRATEALRCALTTPYKPQKALVGKTPRARAMKRKAKGRSKSP